MGVSSFGSALSQHLDIKCGFTNLMELQGQVPVIQGSWIASYRTVGSWALCIRFVTDHTSIFWFLSRILDCSSSSWWQIQCSRSSSWHGWLMRPENGLKLAMLVELCSGDKLALPVDCEAVLKQGFRFNSGKRAFSSTCSLAKAHVFRLLLFSQHWLMYHLAIVAHVPFSHIAHVQFSHFCSCTI